MDENAEITLKTPLRFSKQKIKLFLQEREEWLLQVLATKEFYPKLNPLKEVLLFGLVFQVSDFPVLAKKLQNKPQNHQNHHRGFYLDASKKVIPQRVEYFAKKMQLTPKEIKFRTMKRRWGSCSAQGVLTFNTKLMQKELSFIEEVVVHELAHLVHFNHSKEFQRLVEDSLG